MGIVGIHKAIGHCRVSKGDSDEIRNSLNSQKSEIDKFATKLGINSDEIYWLIEEEARSAYSDRANWSKFEEAIDMACNNSNIKYFIDFSQERFCRSRKRSQLYKDKLRRNGVSLRFVSGDVIDPDSDSGFWVDGVQEIAAEAYSRKVGADTLRGCLENAVTRDPETGYAYKNGGAPPFWLKAKKIPVGKDKYGDDIKKTIWLKNDKIHTARIDGILVTKTMFEWGRYYFAELRLNQKLGIDRARDVLNELGIPAPRKIYWVSTCLYEAEKNPSLIGKGIYNRRQYARGGAGRIKDKTEWVEINDAHPALLTIDEFNALQELSKAKCRKKGVKNVNSNNNHLLVGNPERFYCQSCGSRIISSGRVYTCGIYNTNGKKGCGAPIFNVDCNWLENKIFAGIKRQLTDKNIDKLYNDYITMLAARESNEARIQTLEKVLREKDKASQSLVVSLSTIDIAANEFAVKTITKELNKIAYEKQEIEREIEKLNKPAIFKVPTKDEFKTKMLDIKQALSQSNINQKREIIWMFVSSIIFDPVERKITAEYFSNPISVSLENSLGNEDADSKTNGDPFGPPLKMVAGIGFEPMTFGL